jgi:hypothetical protein
MSFVSIVSKNENEQTIVKKQSNQSGKLDLLHKNLFRSLRKNRLERKNQRFQDWLDFYIEQDNLCIRDIIANMNKKIVEVVNANGFKLNNEFKDEVASYIYYQSKEYGKEIYNSQ